MNKILILAVSVAAQTNPPNWPASVHVFSPSTPLADITSAVNAAYTQNGGHNPPNNGEFSSARFAFLFKPGTYNIDVPVGFYTHVLGLGKSPDDVVFTGPKGVHCEEGSYEFSTGALDTFWRAAENFRTTSNFNWQVGTGMMWAVSQAAPLRRVHVNNQLLLFEYQPPYEAAGYASGGWLSNSQVDGRIVSGSQQQWFTRNSNINSWNGGVWNMVFVGVQGAPPNHCTNQGGLPHSVVNAAPVLAEKPFINVDAAGKYNIAVPAAAKNVIGHNWGGDTAIGFESVFIATPSNTAAQINAQLTAGLNVVLTPGIYNLDAAISITRRNQILLGLGFPTLVSANGNAVIHVGNVDGVKLVGPLLLQAGTRPTRTLLQWGDGAYAGNTSNPGALYDIFARVGGPNGRTAVQSELMVQINSSNVIGDNFWLWRADHTDAGGVSGSANPCQTGLLVAGDDVTMYGLAVEHTLGDLTSWLGERGQTYFYQSELPYDVTQANYGDKGYVGYRVGPNVRAHTAVGLGVYSFMRDFTVHVNSGIAAPAALEPNFRASLSVFLSGQGTISHVINNKGAATQPGTQTAYVC